MEESVWSQMACQVVQSSLGGDKRILPAPFSWLSWAKIRSGLCSLSHRPWLFPLSVASLDFYSTESPLFLGAPFGVLVFETIF